jgi:hypothetical protein
MSRIPKRKSRKIVIDGKPFRWILKGGRIRYRGDSHRSADLVVQEETDKPGDPLVSLFVSTHLTEALEEGYARHHASFTPGDVAKAIRYALAQGWQPSVSTGQVFSLKGSLALKDYALHEPRVPPKPRTFWDRLLEADII